MRFFIALTALIVTLSTSPAVASTRNCDCMTIGSVTYLVSYDEHYKATFLGNHSGDRACRVALVRHPQCREVYGGVGPSRPLRGTSWAYCGKYHRQPSGCVANVAPSGRQCLYDASIGECYDWQWQARAWPDNCGDPGASVFYGLAWTEGDARLNALKECQTRPSPCAKPPSSCHLTAVLKFRRS